MIDTIGNSMADIRSVPVIWPTSKEKVKETKQTEESQQSSRQVSTKSPTSSPATESATASQTAQAAQKAQTAPPPPATRNMSMADVVDYLFQAKIANTEENKLLASFMMQHGIELSEANFNSLFKLTKGEKNANMLESAVINLGKGLNDAPKGADILSNFLQENPQLQQQMVTASQNIANLQSALNSTQQLMNPGLMSGLLSLLSEMDNNFKKLLKSAQEGKTAINEINRGEMIKNIKSFSQLLQGLEQKLAETNQLDSPEAKALQEKIMLLKKSLNEVQENLISQTIISKDSNRSISSINDRFAYWQLPNPFDKNNQIEIAIRKDPHKNKGEIDSSKTRIVLKVNTPEIGEISIIIDILDKKIWYIFNTESEETNHFIKKMHADLIKQMEALNYHVAGFQAIKKKIDFKKFILPTVNLDNMIRISTEV